MTSFGLAYVSEFLDAIINYMCTIANFKNAYASKVSCLGMSFLYAGILCSTKIGAYIINTKNSYLMINVELLNLYLQ